MLTPQINIDAQIKLNDITPDLYAMIQKFAPFGPNNTIPVFMTENVTNFIGSKQVGRNNEHLKLVVVDDTRVCNDRSGIAFGMGEAFSRISKGEYFDICYTLQENEFMGEKRHSNDDSRFKIQRGIKHAIFIFQTIGKSSRIICFLPGIGRKTALRYVLHMLR